MADFGGYLRGRQILLQRSNTQPNGCEANHNDGHSNRAGRDIWKPIAVHVTTKSGIMYCKAFEERPSVVADISPFAVAAHTRQRRHSTMERMDYGTVSAGIIAGVAAVLASALIRPARAALGRWLR